MTNFLSQNCPFKGQFMPGISEANGGQSGQALKENSPISGLLRFLVARGGIDQRLGCLTQLSIAVDFIT
jgi:hypothetical protein